MSSIEDTEAAINDAIEGVTPEPEVEAPEVETPGEPEAEAPAAEPEAILGKFKTQDDLVKAYQELERQFTQERQQAPAPEPEAEPEEPFNPLQNFGYDDADWGNIARSVQQRPEDTINYFLAEGNQEVIDAAFGYWMTLNPFAAQQFAAKHAVAEEREQLEQQRSQIEAMYAEREAVVNKQNASTAYQKIAASLPDFDTYRERVYQLFTARPLADNDARLTDPDAMFDFVKTLYARAKYEEFEAQAQAAQAQPAAKAASKTKTQTRSSAAPVAGIAGDDADFLNEVLAGQPDRD